jgi:hypothetical protein
MQWQPTCPDGCEHRPGLFYHKPNCPDYKYAYYDPKLAGLRMPDNWPLPNTNKQTPPDWVLKEAAKRSECLSLPITKLRDQYLSETYAGFSALCDMIEKYEQPPVDRKVLCAREAIQEAARALTSWSQEDVCIRAIELWKEGFGK